MAKKRANQKKHLVSEIVLNIILPLVVSSVIAIVGNQLTRKELILSEKNQSPIFRVEAEYQDEHMTGYNLVSSGGTIEHLNVQIERLIHLDTKGPIAWGDFYIPYGYIAEYFMLPSSSESISLYQQNEFSNPLDINNFATELGAKLTEENQGYLIQSLDILTISYSDYNRIRHTEKYILATNSTSNCTEVNTSNAIYLFPLNEDTLQYIESKKPKCFDRFCNNSDISYFLPNELYSNIASDDYFEIRNGDVDRDRFLVNAAIEYISTMGFKSSY